MADNVRFTEESYVEDVPWYQSMWSWFGDTAKDIYTSKLQSDQAKYEAEVLAKEQAANESIDLFGQEVSKTTLLWVAGGSLLVTLLVLVAKR